MLALINALIIWYAIGLGTNLLMTFRNDLRTLDHLDKQIIFISSFLGPLLSVFALLCLLEDLTGWRVVSYWLDKLTN